MTTNISLSISILLMPKLTSSNTTHLARCLQGKNSAYNVTLLNTQYITNKTWQVNNTN